MFQAKQRNVYMLVVLKKSQNHLIQNEVSSEDHEHL